MKKLLVLFAVLTLLFSCQSVKKYYHKIFGEKSASEKFVVVPKDKINDATQKRAYTLGRRLLDACNTSKFTPYTKSEATDKVIANATVEKISQTCKIMNSRNGKFLDLKLLDVTQDTDTKEYIFRYDIDYEKKYFKRELKITMNKENKISAISTKESSKVM
jgi:hypothetical protein